MPKPPKDIFIPSVDKNPLVAYKGPMSNTHFDDFFARVAQSAGISSQKELAAMLGVDRSAITQAKRRNAPPEKWILKLSREFGYNPDWLESGRGPIYQGQAAPPFAEEFVKVPKVRARLSAGGGSFETEGTIEGYYAFRAEWLRRKGAPERMALMDILGSSMEPDIKEGDTVLIDQSQKDIFAGGVYAVGVEDTVLLKRLEKRPNALALISNNKDYPPLILRGEEAEAVRVIGRLVWLCRDCR